MKLRFSVFSGMAVAILVAFDAAAIRSLGSRPEFLIQDMRWLLLTTLPMVNVLAVVAFAGKTPRDLGFLVAGWAAVVAIGFTNRPVLDALDYGLVLLGVDPWLVRYPFLEAVLVYAMVPALFLAMALLAATLGGLTARKLWGTGERPRTRYASLAALAAIAVLPLVVVEVTLGLTVDPLLARLGAGSRAVVDFDGVPGSSVRPPAGSPLLDLAGATVRIESDDSDYVPEMVVSSATQKVVLRDRRTIRVSLADGGEPVSLPHCTLRPIR
ncbi:MAG: hypothetical protein U0800_07005 [Isosphaeraceae bacterium]